MTRDGLSSRHANVQILINQLLYPHTRSQFLSDGKAFKCRGGYTACNSQSSRRANRKERYRQARIQQLANFRASPLGFQKQVEFELGQKPEEKHRNRIDKGITETLGLI